MYKFNLKVADFVFGVKSYQPSFLFQMGKPYDQFVCNDDPDITVYGYYSKIPKIKFKIENKVFDSGTFWEIYRVDSKPVFVLKIPFRNHRPYCSAVFDPDLLNYKVYYSLSDSKKQSPNLLPHPLDFPLFHLLMISLLSHGYGVLVHACGIDDNGKGLLFLGSSGKGKSTMARLWKDEAVILNDERIILRQNKGKIWIYGTPWHGEYEGISPTGAVLDKIFFLHHGEMNKITHQTISIATSMILSHCFLPYWEPDGMQFTLDFCAKLVETIPCSELSFIPDKSIIDFIRCVK